MSERDETAGSDPALEERIRRFDRILELLAAPGGEDLPVERLAERAQMSPFHFHRVFRGIMGETVRGYARRVRLEAAARRLAAGADPVLDVALDAGYRGPEAFARAFRRQYGCSPSEYRGGTRPAPPAPAPAAHAPAVRIEHAPATTVARVRHTGAYDQVGDAWKALFTWGWKRMILRRPATFGLCHDDPDVTAPDALRYDACMVVPPSARVRGRVQLDQVPAATYAVVVHRGPYTLLGETYGLLCAEIDTRPVAGARWDLGPAPSKEVYLNDPRRTAEADLRTEVWMPVLARAET